MDEESKSSIMNTGDEELLRRKIWLDLREGLIDHDAFSVAAIGTALIWLGPQIFKVFFP